MHSDGKWNSNAGTLSCDTETRLNGDEDSREQAGCVASDPVCHRRRARERPSGGQAEAAVSRYIGVVW